MVDRKNMLFFVYTSCQKLCRFLLAWNERGFWLWVPLLACPAVLLGRTLPDKPTVASIRSKSLGFATLPQEGAW